VYKQDEAVRSSPTLAFTRIHNSLAQVIEALLAGGANPHIGAPTAWQAAKMFRLEKWEQRFMEAR
jgi:hypothetical protein